MPAIDLKGIHFRAYSPQFDRGLADDEYNPTGPGDVSPVSGAIELDIIKFRAWQRNDLDSDIENNGDINADNEGGTGGGGSPGEIDPGGIGSIQPDGIIWPFAEILNV